LTHRSSLAVGEIELEAGQKITMSNMLAGLELQAASRRLERESIYLEIETHVR